ncbi:hypothetical protein [Nonlabens antarcticus]|uniref:hypothetical protein n=1 Tax=Nonlabens antarcticus TaxID=392714 RepID=UPI00189172D3|nr:hypothetical protein [Nonlabens antarcticus]
MKNVELFYTPSMIWGPIRLFLFLALAYYINIISSRKVSKRRGLDYFILRCSLLITALVLASLFLTQIDSYDLFIIIIIFMALSLLRFMNLNFSKPLQRQLAKIRRRSILYTIKSVEYGQRIIGAKNFNKQNKRAINSNVSVENRFQNKGLQYQSLIAVFLALLAMGSRYYFFLFDTYLLSDLWYADLQNMKDITLQHWFFNDGVMMGHVAVINFYSDITGITDAVAITSFGLIETALLTVSIFWSVNKLMRDTIASGIVAALSFMFLYILLPLDINLMTQPKSVFLAMSLALPFLVYLVDPAELPAKSKHHFITLFVLALAVLFTNLFVGIFFLPVVILITSLHNWKCNKERVTMSIFSYLSAIAIALVILGIAAVVQQYSLVYYLKTNLYQISTYTYAPQLIVPVSDLILIYQIASGLLVLATSFAYLKNRSYKGLNILSLLMFIFFLLPSFELFFIDQDVLNQLLSIFVPMLIAGWVYTIYISGAYFTKTDPLSFNAKLVVAAGATILVLVLTTGNTLTDYPKKNPVNSDIVKVYDQMNSDLSPFSYVVVHNSKNAKLSKLKHFFLDYDTFNEEYLDKDKQYQTYKDDHFYLKSNPEVVLPQSTFVFMYDRVSSANKQNDLKTQDQIKASHIINVLRERGREINIYYKTPRITVYEIVNEPNATKVKDLLI